MKIRNAMLAQNLERLMKSKKVTVADLSRALGISYTTINDWVHGVTYPRDEKLEQLANYFGVDPDALRIGKIRRPHELADWEYVSQYLEDKAQVESFIRLLDAYQEADTKTRKAVNVLLGIEW